MSAVKRYHYLKVLKEATPRARKDLIKNASSQDIKAIGECCHNLLAGNLSASAQTRRKLQPYKNTIRKLAKKTTSIKTKKRILNQRGGFLSALLGLALPLLSQILKV